MANTAESTIWMLPQVHFRHMEIGFYTERSIEDELERETAGDVITIAISYLIMFAYITFALGRINRPSRLPVRPMKMLSESQSINPLPPYVTSLSLDQRPICTLPHGDFFCPFPPSFIFSSL